MDNEELAIRTWIEGNLGVTTATLPTGVGRRWQRLHMKNTEAFFRLAVYGFVLRCRVDKGDDSYPEDEFTDFCGEFVQKLHLAIRGKGTINKMPMFARSGRNTVVNALWCAREPLGDRC